MDSLSQQLDQYLRLMSRTTLLVSQADRRNIDVLLTMLGPVDKAIIEAHYGLNGKTAADSADITRRYRLTATQLQHIIATDLRRLAVTPEWQMLWQQMPPMVKTRINHDTHLTTK